MRLRNSYAIVYFTFQLNWRENKNKAVETDAAASPAQKRLMCNLDFITTQICVESTMRSRYRFTLEFRKTLTFYYYFFKIQIGAKIYVKGVCDYVISYINRIELPIRCRNHTKLTEKELFVSNMNKLLRKR